MPGVPRGLGKEIDGLCYSPDNFAAYSDGDYFHGDGAHRLQEVV